MSKPTMIFVERNCGGAGVSALAARWRARFKDAGNLPPVVTKLKRRDDLRLRQVIFHQVKADQVWRHKESPVALDPAAFIDRTLEALRR